MADWKKIAREYITTEIAMRALADKHGVPWQTLAAHARKEMWTEHRKEYRIKTGKEAVKKAKLKQTNKTNKTKQTNGTELQTNPRAKDVNDAALLFEGATLAINWIIRRLESDEVSDWREVEGLIRAMNGAKALTRIKSALDEEEQRARIDNLKKSTEIAGREPVQIEFVNTEDTAK